MKQPNEAARDLWRQIFERAAAQPDAALFRPDEDSGAKQAELAAQALLEAGWSEAEIKRRNEASLLHADLEHPNSPGVAPGLEFRLQVLADRVKRVIAEIGDTEHEQVEVAIDPIAGVSASLTNVIMTDQGILAVSSFLFRWCGLIARAYTRTLYAELTYWTSTAPDIGCDRAALLRSPDVVHYWFRIFTSFSLTGTHALVPFRPSTPTEFHLFEQVAWAMEYFTIAHEFGHHVLGHRQVGDDPKRQEFEADAFSAKICDQLEFEPFPLISNPYTRTGAGGSLMLISLEILRCFEGTPDLGTHPVASDRVDRISSRNLIFPKQFGMDQDFNGTVKRIMNAVAMLMEELRIAADHFRDSEGSKEY
jgi:hypothetical protein